MKPVKRGGSRKIYKCSESVQIITQITIKDHIVGMHRISIELINLKLNKIKMAQAFCFGLKFWSQLKINETPNFSQTSSL